MPLGFLHSISVLSPSLHSPTEHHSQAAPSVLPSKVLTQLLPQVHSRMDQNHSEQRFVCLELSENHQEERIRKRRCCSSQEVEPALHEKRKSLLRADEGDSKPPPSDVGTAEVINTGIKRVRWKKRSAIWLCCIFVVKTTICNIGASCDNEY
jgi:hypothetical protein